MTSNIQELRQIRQQNARWILDKKCNGVIQQFADAIDRGHSQVSAFLRENAKTHIGNKVARLIEHAFNLPDGWLDQQHDGQVDDFLSSVRSTAMSGSISSMLTIWPQLEEHYQRVTSMREIIYNSIDIRVKESMNQVYGQDGYFLINTLMRQVLERRHLNEAVEHRVKVVLFAHTVENVIKKRFANNILDNVDVDLWFYVSDISGNDYLCQVPTEFVTYYKQQGGNDGFELGRDIGEFAIKHRSKIFNIDRYNALESAPQL